MKEMLDWPTFPLESYPSTVSFRNTRAMAVINKFNEGNKLGFTLPIMGVFLTFEGEGTRIGAPRVFVRIGGCAIMCKGCDTPESFNLEKSAKIATTDWVVSEVRRLSAGFENVEVHITGGEPMHYPVALSRLAEDLRLNMPNVSLSLETSGLILDTKVFRLFDYLSLDIKTPSSGVAPEIWQIADIFNMQAKCTQPSAVQVKVVVTNQEDLTWIREALLTTNQFQGKVLPLILTPAAAPGQCLDKAAEGISRTMSMIQEWNRGYNIRVIPQIHKLLGFA